MMYQHLRKWLKNSQVLCQDSALSLYAFVSPAQEETYLGRSGLSAVCHCPGGVWGSGLAQLCGVPGVWMSYCGGWTDGVCACKSPNYQI